MELKGYETTEELEDGSEAGIGVVLGRAEWMATNLWLLESRGICSVVKSLVG